MLEHSLKCVNMLLLSKQNLTEMTVIVNGNHCTEVSIVLAEASGSNSENNNGMAIFVDEGCWTGTFPYKI